MSIEVEKAGISIQWPTDIESRKAISVLNTWLDELYCNGADNAIYELSRGEKIWYFSSDFNKYMMLSLKIINETALSDRMRSVTEYIDCYLNRKFSTSSDEVYQEVELISNWEQLQIESLDFIKSEPNLAIESVKKKIRVPLTYFLSYLEDNCEDFFFRIIDGKLILTYLPL